MIEHEDELERLFHQRLIARTSNDDILKELSHQMNDLEPVPAPAPPPKLDDIANMLATYYGHVVILVTEKDPEKDESILHYCWRGGYYAARGMLDRMKDIMRADGHEDDDDRRGPRMTSGYGVETDIVTGEPMVDVRDAREDLAKQQAQEKVAEGQAMRMALESVEGNILLTRALEAIELRVDELIQADPQCQGMLRLLETFNVKLQLGRRAAERLLSPLLRRPMMP